MALDPNTWTLKTQEAFNAAVGMARERANPEVTPDHLLAALLGQSEGVVLPVLAKSGVQLQSLKNQVEEAVAKLPRAYGGESQVGRALRDVLERATVRRTPWATSTCRPSTSCWRCTSASGSPGKTSSAR